MTYKELIDKYWALNDSLYFIDYGDKKWDVIKELNTLCEKINGQATT